jgi:hypothetical protein
VVSEIIAELGEHIAYRRRPGCGLVLRVRGIAFRSVDVNVNGTLASVIAPVIEPTIVAGNRNVAASDFPDMKKFAGAIIAAEPPEAARGVKVQDPSSQASAWLGHRAGSIAPITATDACGSNGSEPGNILKATGSPVSISPRLPLMTDFGASIRGPPRLSLIKQKSPW